MRDNKFFYSEKSKDASTSHVQIEDDKVKAPVETKCPVCQEHHHISGLTDEFDLHIKEDILILTVETFYSDIRFQNKIKYCPFCGRKL